MKSRQRLDEAVVTRGLAENRSRAQALILAGAIVVDGTAARRAGVPVSPESVISLKEPPKYVSRGGEKLEHALRAFRIDVAGRIAADFGASTGGFTDALLQAGAARVYAVDVGYGQLATRLREDPRVVVLERTNARYLTALPESIDLVTIDVSFIGLRLVLPAALRVLREQGDIVALIKPQFEAGRHDVGRGGVVRDRETHRRVLREVFATAEELGLGVAGLAASPLRGPAGNIEFLTHLIPGVPSLSADITIERALEEAPAA